MFHLINFRLAGYGEDTLATMFGCDRTALIYQFKKYNIPKPKEVYVLERIISQLLPKPEPEKWKIVNGARINLGKSYRDYLK